MQITLGRNRVLQALARSPLVPFIRAHEKAEGAVVLVIGTGALWTLLGAGVASAAIVGTGMIDLSNNNGPAAAAAISAPGVQAVEAKATEGLGFHDSLYPHFRAVAAAHHRAFGGYMFIHPDESGKAQADYFLTYAHPHRGNLQPVVDSEIGSPCSAAPSTLAALRELTAKGYRPILYSNTYWLGQLKTCAPALEAYRVWEAEYGPTLTLIPGFHVIAWQFTDAAHEGGFSVDGSHLLVRNVTQLEILLAKQKHHHLKPKPKPKPKPKKACKHVYPKTLRLGSHGDAVHRLQVVLDCHAAHPKVKTDGHFGAATRRAVRRFQRHHKIRPSGIVGRRTRAALNR